MPRIQYLHPDEACERLGLVPRPGDEDRKYDTADIEALIQRSKAAYQLRRSH